MRHDAILVGGSFAGLSAEHVRAEGVVQTPTQPYPLASIVGSVLDRILERGVAAAEDIDIESLEARRAAERLACGSTVFVDMMAGAWARKSA